VLIRAGIKQGRLTGRWVPQSLLSAVKTNAAQRRVGLDFTCVLLVAPYL